MISPRDSPEGEYNKFLTGLEGHRGVLLATAYEGTLGVIRALTSSNKIRAKNYTWCVRWIPGCIHTWSGWLTGYQTTLCA